MKKTICIILLAFTFLLSFTACDTPNQDPDPVPDNGDNANVDDQKNEETIVTTITSAEWKNAIDISKFQSFTLTGTDIGSEDGHDFDITITAKYYLGLLYVSYEGQGYDGENSHTSYSKYNTDEIKNIYRSLEGLETLGWIISDFEDFEDFGFSCLTYNENEKCYQFFPDSDTLYSFWFKNGKLAKYSYEENGQVEYLTCAYTFSDINSTGRISIPRTDIEAKFDNVVNSISANTIYTDYDNGETAYGSELKAILKSVELDEIIKYSIEFTDGELSGFDIETGSMSTSNPSISLSMHKSKVSYIKLDYNGDFRVYRNW